MLKGEYAGLRAIERDDLKQLLEWRNLPEFRCYFREYRELGMENQEQWYQRIVVNDPNTMMFAIVNLSDGMLLGAAGLAYINWVNRNADFSIYIGRESLYIDDKYAPDAGYLLLEYGFNELGLHRIWTEIYDFDERKKELFNKLSFSLDGCHRQTYWNNGKWHNSLFYSILTHEFKKK